jgi:hypothetical protein
MPMCLRARTKPAGSRNHRPPIPVASARQPLMLKGPTCRRHPPPLFPLRAGQQRALLPPPPARGRHAWVVLDRCCPPVGPRRLVPLGRSRGPKCRPSTVPPHFNFFSKLKISRKLSKLLKYIENGIKLRKI